MKTKRNSNWALAILLFSPLAALAGGVVTTCTEAALRAALAGGGTVTFACDGTITLASPITNSLDTVLDASGHQITISGGNAVRVFCVTTNVSFTAVNLTLSDGNSLGGSGILNLGGTVNLTGVTLSGNTATISASNDALSPKASGGAIFNRGGTVNAINCSFSGNSVQTPYSSLYMGPPDTLLYGRTIRNEAGRMSLQSCAFVGNRAIGGGPPISYLPVPGDSVGGGAIHNSGTLTLDLCTLTGNSATDGAAGGLQYMHEGGAGGESRGGAICNEGALTVDRTSLTSNTATGGSGGMGGSGDPLGEPTLDGFLGGSGGGAYGAAIYSRCADSTHSPCGELLVTRSTFANNVATGGAGGDGGGGRTFVDTGGSGARGGNGGSGLGGAVFGLGSLVNCTITLNTGIGAGGGKGGDGASARCCGSGGAGAMGGAGVGAVAGLSVTLTNCTLVQNFGQAGSGGAGGAAGSPPCMSGPPGPSGYAWGGGTIAAMVNTLSASNTPAGGDNFADAKLGPLADNGGSTLTMALLPGSPAIDRGNTSLAPAIDQRGFPRPAGSAADVGSFEYGSVMPNLAISRSGAAGFDFIASGNTGQLCRLLISSDLSSWFPIATSQIGGDGTTLFHDTCAPGRACQFYRVVMP
jgi:hypothetical protein